MKADLIFYSENFGGNCKIPADEFPAWEVRAGKILSKMSGGKSDSEDIDSVKMCICEIAELLYEENKRKGILSENNDGYSVKYENGDIKNRIGQVASLWLSGTDILYRGV